MSILTAKPHSANPSPVTRRAASPAAGPAARVTADLGVLAGKVKWLRIRDRMTLQELADRSGIAQSTLSKIENGQLSPTYEKIIALAEGLKVDVSELFSASAVSSVTGRRGVSRHAQGYMHSTPQYDYEVLCSDLSGKTFVPLKTRIKAHSLHEFPELSRHPGEEFVYVLSGKVLIHSEYYQPLILETGDSCYFDSTMGHALISGTETDAEILWVCSKTVGIDEAP